LLLGFLRTQHFLVERQRGVFLQKKRQQITTSQKKHNLKIIKAPRPPLRGAGGLQGPLKNTTKTPTLPPPHFAPVSFPCAIT